MSQVWATESTGSSAWLCVCAWESAEGRSGLPGDDNTHTIEDEEWLVVVDDITWLCHNFSIVFHVYFAKNTTWMLWPLNGLPSIYTVSWLFSSRRSLCHQCQTLEEEWCNKEDSKPCHSIGTYSKLGHKFSHWPCRNLLELTLKLKISVWRNHSSSPSIAIRKGRRNAKDLLVTYLDTLRSMMVKFFVQEVRSLLSIPLLHYGVWVTSRTPSSTRAWIKNYRNSYLTNITYNRSIDKLKTCVVAVLHSVTTHHRCSIHS